MSFSTDLGWLNIQELDPRVDKLVTVAIRAMARGEGHAYSPHMLYSDMKPYLAALIGTWRGTSGQPVARHKPMLAHEQEFLAVLSEPWTGTPASDGYLRTQWLFDVACNHVLDKLTDVHDSLHGYAA
jgi:hypothetical protein